MKLQTKLKPLALAGLLALTAMPALAQPPADGAEGTAPPARRGGGFAAMDTNKDGVITKDEWTAAGRRPRAFDRIDADHDGKITRDEISAFRAARRNAAGRDSAAPAAPPAGQ